MARKQTPERKRQNAEAQARWLETHAGEYERLSVRLPLGTKAGLQKVARRAGMANITELLESIAGGGQN